jgi:hypothetical protein
MSTIIIEKIQNLHNQVDTSDLVHELHAIGKKNTPSSLHLVSLEDLAPPMEMFVSNCNHKHRRILVTYWYSPCKRSSASASRMSFCSRAIFGSSGVPSYTSHRTCRASSLRPFAYRYLGDSGMPKTMMTTTCFVLVAVAGTWHKHTHNRKDDLASNWQPPRNGTSHIGNSVVEEVGDDDTDTDEKRLGADNATTFVCFNQFALVHRNSAGLNTGSDASNVASDENLWYSIASRLQNSTDNLGQSVQRKYICVLERTMKTQAIHIDRRRPAFSPPKKANIHPLKAPYVRSVFGRYCADTGMIVQDCISKQ